MIHVAAIRMQQFGVSFYQASLTARDVSRLVRFEVLSYGEQRHPPVRGRKGQGPARSKVNWDLLERRIAGTIEATDNTTDYSGRRLAWPAPPTMVRARC